MFEVVLAIAGIVAGALISWGLCYYYYHKARNLRYSVMNRCWIKDHKPRLPNLEVSYKGFGPELESLSVATVCFWNDSSTAINRSDISKDNPLLITLTEGDKVLDANVMFQSDAGSSISVKRTSDRSGASVEFKFLNRWQGAVIELVHTGVSSSQIQITGSIKNLDGIKKVGIDRRFGGRLAGLGLSLAITCAVWVSFYSSLVSSMQLFPDQHWLLLAGVATMIAYAIFLFYQLGLLIEGLYLWRLMPPDPLMRRLTNENAQSTEK